MKTEHYQPDLGPIEKRLRTVFSSDFRREKRAYEEEQREAVHASIRGVIDGYAEAWGEPIQATTAVSYSGTAEGTTVAVKGTRNIDPSMGNSHILYAKTADDHGLAFYHTKSRVVTELYYGVRSPGEDRYRWSSTPPSWDFVANVRAIWPTIDLASQMPRPRRADRRMEAGRAAAAQKFAGRA